MVTTLARAPGRARAGAPDVRAYDSLEALAADGVDAVAISTPADTHIPLALQAIGLGMAVVVDKPFALDAADARDGDRRGRDGRRRAQRLPEPALGLRPADRAAAARAGRARRGPAVRVGVRAVRRRAGPPAAGGGILRDFGSHLVDQALLLFGPATSVYAEMRRPRTSSTTASSSRCSTRRRDAPTSAATGARARPRRACGSAAARALRRRRHGRPGAPPDRGPLPRDRGRRWGAESREPTGAGSSAATPGEPVPSERGRWDTYYPAFAAAVRGERAGPRRPHGRGARPRGPRGRRAQRRRGDVVSL